MLTGNFIRRSALFVAVFVLLGIANAFSQDNLEKGIDAVKKGDYVKALEYLKSAPKDKYEGSLYYGIALFKTGSLAEAEKSLNAAIKIDNERPEAYSTLGELFTSQKKYSDAAAQFDDARKYLPLNKTKDNLDPEEINQIISTLTKEAENFIADGKVDKAIASLTMAKTYTDKDPMVYVGLGDAYLARGSFDIAATNYQTGLKLKPYAPAYYGLGKIAFKKKKYSDALEQYTKATETDNNFAPAFFEKGLLLYLNDNFKMAVEAFDRYLTLVPGSQRGNVYKGKSYYGMGDYDKALEILTAVLTAEPNNSEANKYAAYVYIEKKEYAKAEEFFTKVKADELNSEDYMKWAKIYVDKKDFPKAYEYLDKATTLDSAYEDAYFEYGKALFAEQKYADALTKLNKAIDLGILNVAAYVYKGICLFYLNDFDAGVVTLEKSISLNPNISSAYLWKANCLAASKKNPEAVAVYKKYLEMQPDDQFAKDQIEKLSKQ